MFVIARLIMTLVGVLVLIELCDPYWLIDVLKTLLSGSRQAVREGGGGRGNITLSEPNPNPS